MRTEEIGRRTCPSVGRGDCPSVIQARWRSTRPSCLRSSVRPTTINRKLCAVKAGLTGYLAATYGREKAEVLKNAYKVVKGIKLSKNERVIRPESVLSEDEIERLIKAADPKTSLIILFLSKTGCRISEALNITIGDVKENDDAVEISVVGKGQKGRTVYLAKDDLLRMRQTFKGKKYLFETIHGNRYDKVNVTKKIGKLSESVLGQTHQRPHSQAFLCDQHDSEDSEDSGNQRVPWTLLNCYHPGHVHPRDPFPGRASVRGCQHEADR